MISSSICSHCQGTYPYCKFLAIAIWIFVWSPWYWYQHAQERIIFAQSHFYSLPLWMSKCLSFSQCDLCRFYKWLYQRLVATSVFQVLRTDARYPYTFCNTHMGVVNKRSTTKKYENLHLAAVQDYKQQP